jgi:putative ABC transport system permease protein
LGRGTRPWHLTLETLFVTEAFRFALDSLRANRLRAVLTGLGMVIGTASVILVATIALTGRDYILAQIQGVGSNLVYAAYEADETKNRSLSDFLTLADLEAVRRDLTGIKASTAIIINFDRMMVAGRERDISVIGTSPDFRIVRNLTVPSGRFMDEEDLGGRNKVCLLTGPLAQKLFGSEQQALEQRIRIHGLQFTVIGAFKEGVETFGQSEITKETVLIPITVMRYFTDNDRVDQLYVSMIRQADVLPATARVKRVLETRHRPGSVYRVENLSEILSAARRISIALTVVLILISAVTLIIGGIGIMNIMLVTVTERTREIGIKMAIGARRREILYQFLSEAIVLSVGGGAIGVLVGLAVPLAARFFVAGLKFPVSGLSIAIAFGVSGLVGIVFGIVPANRASRLHPTEALRYE